MGSRLGTQTLPHSAVTGVPVTMLPLDVTHRALATPARLDRIRALNNRAGATVAGMLGFSERFDKEKYGGVGAPVLDPNVIAWLLRPELYAGRRVNVAVECASPLTLGMTVADYWRVTKREPNALFLRDVDDAGFFDLLTERLGRLP